MSEQDQQRRQTQLRSIMESARRKMDEALESSTAKGLGQRLDRLGDEIEGAVKSPKGREVVDRIEKQFKDLDAEIDKALKSPRAQEVREDLSKVFDDMGKEIEKALESDTSKELQLKVGKFLEDIGQRLSSRGEEKK